MNYSLNNNNVKKFQTKFGRFEMMIPSEWEEYDDEEGTYAFFDPNEWKGNFRITPFQFERNVDETTIENLLNKPFSKIIAGDKICLYYIEEIKSEDEHSIMYNWYFYLFTYMFISTFTINYGDKNSDKTKAELSKIISMINSLKLI